jgi:ribosomal protein S18 acetylase RimI-like enzyme
MWVAPEARGQGVGNALIDAVIEYARSSGAIRLLLDVGDHNQQAIALYARKGFKPNGQTGSLPAPRNHIREHQRELRL